MVCACCKITEHIVLIGQLGIYYINVHNWPYNNTVTIVLLACMIKSKSHTAATCFLVEKGHKNLPGSKQSGVGVVGVGLSQTRDTGCLTEETGTRAAENSESETVIIY